MSALISFALKRKLHTSMCRTKLLDYSLQPVFLGSPTGFISNCFYSSEKLWTVMVGVRLS